MKKKIRVVKNFKIVKRFCSLDRYYIVAERDNEVEITTKLFSYKFVKTTF